MKKKRIENIIGIILFAYLLIVTIFNVITGFQKGSLSIEMENLPVGIGVLFLMSIISFIIAIFQNFIVIICFVGFKLAMVTYRRNQLDKIDFKNKEVYYRDIIQQYSPGVLSYVDDFEVGKEDIVATLLKLQLKGCITLNDKIEVVANESKTTLDKSEKYVLDHIKEGKVEYDKWSYEEKVVADTYSYKLVESREDFKKKFYQKILMFIVVGTFLFATAPIFPIWIGSLMETQNIVLIGILCVLFIITIFAGAVFPFFQAFYLLTYLLRTSRTPYIRTKKGKELNIQLEGLRKYLKEYSNMGNKKAEELVLWEDYLIYSVLLRQNEIVVKELEKYIKS